MHRNPTIRPTIKLHVKLNNKPWKYPIIMMPHDLLLLRFRLNIGTMLDKS